LAFFNPEKEIVVNVDASSHSLGAVLLQDGRPVEYAAQSLTPTQCRYAQIEKEFLAIQFGLSHFHQYTYGRPVVVETDHKPLVYIVDKPLNDLTPRLQRIKMKTQYYEYNVKYKPGKEMYISDLLSRFCPPSTYVQDLEFVDPMVGICEIRLANQLVKEQFMYATEQDSTMQVLTNYVLKGWPSQLRYCHPAAKPYWNIRNAISEHDGLLFYMDRVIVPGSKQGDMVKKLHEGHQGTTKILQRARTALYWPGMGPRIEDCLKSCVQCQNCESKQTYDPLIVSEIPDHPWQILGSDLFQIAEEHFLITVDYYTKWINVAPIKDVTSQGVITELRRQFADFGNPVIFRSDNGPQYASREFKEFMSELSISHVTSSPAYARSNGQAENAVKTVKQMIKKCKDENKDWWKGLQLLRNTPLAPDMPSPAQLLQGRNLHDGIPVSLNCLFPRAYDRTGVRNKFEKRQDRMKYYHDSHCGREKSVLKEGDNVRYLSQKGRWEPAVVVKPSDNIRSYHIKDMLTEQVIRRNRNFLRKDLTPPEERSKEILAKTVPSKVTKTAQAVPTIPKPVQPKVGQIPAAPLEVTPSRPSQITSQNSPSPSTSQSISNAPDNVPKEPVNRTKSGRVITKPIRYR
jgi:hypothetical protein